MRPLSFSFFRPGTSRFEVLWVLALGMLIFQGQTAAQTGQDSLKIYKDLKSRSRNSKLMRWVFDQVVVLPGHTHPGRIKTQGPKKIPHENHAGKVISNVKIRILEPFGPSVEDTSRSETNLEKWGNRLHTKTRAFLIRNQLLFTAGDRLDVLRLSESERILRQTPYLTDARMIVIPVGSSKDTVEVQVWVQDQWTLYPNSNFNASKPDLLFTDRNFLGLGTSLKQNNGYRWSDKSVHNEGRFGIFNIEKSFLSSDLEYRISPEENRIGVTLDRPFYSPLARWAGGLAMNRFWTWFVPDGQSVLPQNSRFPLGYFLANGWFAKSWQVGNPSLLRNRTTSVIAGIRSTHTEFLEKPDETGDPFRQNQNQTLFLANLGISRRRFYKEKYLYRFGANEDVPVGFTLQILGGHLFREKEPNRYYNGISASAGDAVGAGYMAVQLAYGHFYNLQGLNQGLVRGNVTYFSPLIQQGRWAMRQFASVGTLIGLDREPYEYLDLNNTLYGFNSPVLRSDSRMVLNLETVFYLPYNIFGFRLAPVLFMGFGKLGKGWNGALNSPVYQAYSIGLLVRNENLVFNTFEVSLGFYPWQPGNPDGFQVNPIQEYRLRVQDFLVAKPEVLEYR